MIGFPQVFQQDAAQKCSFSLGFGGTVRARQRAKGGEGKGGGDRRGKERTGAGEERSGEDGGRRVEKTGEERKWK